MKRVFMNMNPTPQGKKQKLSSRESVKGNKSPITGYLKKEFADIQRFNKEWTKLKGNSSVQTLQLVM